MSQSVYINFVVKNIQEIHEEEDEIKRNASYAAAQNFIKTIGFEHEEIIVDFIGQAGDLSLYSPGLINISGLTAWGEETVQKWKEMAFSVLGPDCRPVLEVEFADGGILDFG